MARNVMKRTSNMRAQQRFRSAIRAVWSESLQGEFWIVKYIKFSNADNDDSDQTARMRSLIRVFVGSTCQKGHFSRLLW